MAAAIHPGCRLSRTCGERLSSEKAAAQLGNRCADLVVPGRG